MNLADHYIYSLRKGEKTAFKKLYAEKFAKLCSFANKFIKDRDASVDIVQDVFVNLWDNRETIRYNTSIDSFLFVSVRNACINYLRRKNSKEKLHQSYSDLSSESVYEFNVLEKQVYDQVYNYIQELPIRTREIMIMTLNGVSNSEMKDELDVSINTVKTLKRNAYKKMKEKFKNLN